MLLLLLLVLPSLLTPLSLLRYHDHALHITLDNAYHGLSGFYLMSDKLRHGGCGEPYNLEVGYDSTQ